MTHTHTNTYDLITMRFDTIFIYILLLFIGAFGTYTHGHGWSIYVYRILYGAVNVFVNLIIYVIQFSWFGSQ